MIRSRFAAAFSVALLFGAVSAGMCEDGKLDFRLKLVPGTSYSIVDTSESSRTIKAQNKTTKTSDFAVLGSTIDVIAVDESGNATIKVTNTKIRKFRDTPSKWIDFDSTKAPKAGNATERILSLLKDTSYTATISPSGKIVAVNGLERMRVQVRAGLAGLKGKDLKEAEKELERCVSNEAVQSDLAALFDVYPQNSVSVGERWMKILPASEDDPFTVKNYSKITEVADGQISVKVYSAFLPHLRMSEDGDKSAMFGSGSTDGVAIFDVATGFLKSSKASGTIEYTGTWFKGSKNIKVQVTEYLKESTLVEQVK